MEKTPLRDLTKYTSLQPLLVGVSAFLAYTLTAAHGYTWLNNGVDGGDLLAAALTNGIAHPSGYPLYTFLLRMLFWVFPANPAFAANIFNGLITALTGVLLAFLLSRRMRMAGADERYSDLTSAAIAAVYLGAPLVWSHATVVEVYPLHLLLLTVLLVLTEPRAPKEMNGELDLMVGLVFGLSLANHVTSIFALPLLLPYERIVFGKRAVITGLILRIGVGLLVAIGFYLSLLFADPSSPVRWMDPRSISDLFDLVSGAIYRPYLSAPNDFTLSRLLAMPGWLVEQVGAFGLFLGVWGLAYTSRRFYHEVAIISLAVAAFVFSLFYPTYDSYVNLLPVVLVFTLWAGDGMAHLGRVAKGGKAGAAVIVVLVVNILFGVTQNLPPLNVSADTQARDFSTAILRSAPPNSVILALRDKELFALWYAHEGQGVRPDVTIIAEPLAFSAWYQRLMLRVMPPIVVPSTSGARAWRAANPTVEICEVLGLDPPLLDCGSTP